MPHLRLSFDLRRPAFSTASSAELYGAMLDICGWADERGFDLVYFGEHHCADDGYLPSPLSACAAVAGRTQSIRLRPILLTPLYHPLRLAEEIAVVDLLSAGRLSPVFAAGYRPAEFDMYGVALADRRGLVNEAVRVCKAAWTGEPFEFEGRTVTVTPTPAQSPRPPITLGASRPSIARQAAHIADGFDPAEPALWEVYRQERLSLGAQDPGPWAQRGPTFLYVTRDPDGAWAEVGPHLLHAANTYAQWIQADRNTISEWYPPIADIGGLQASGAYQFVTPERCVEIANALGPSGHLILRPLFGGVDPRLAWESLELFDREVLPALR